MRASLPQFNRYLKVFSGLLFDLIRQDKAAMIFGLLGITAAAIIYPLPFALIVSAIFSAIKNDTILTINILDYSLTLRVFDAIMYGIVMGVFAYLLNLIFTRFLIHRTMLWQDKVFWRLANNLAVYPKINMFVPTLPWQSKKISSVLMQSTTACTQIGRLATNGVHSVVLLIVTFTIISIIDWRISLFMVISGIALIPLYAKALSTIVKVRHEMLDQKIQKRPELNAFLKRVSLSQTYNQVDASESNRRFVKYFSPIYTVINNQYLALAGVQFLVATHMLLLLAAMVFFVRSNTQISTSHILILFVVLVLFARTTVGLVGLMSNLTRNYTNITRLSNMLRPDLNEVARSASSVELSSKLEIKDTAGNKSIQLTAGDKIPFRSPKMEFTYQLAPISNRASYSLDKTRQIDSILFIDEDNLDLLTTPYDALKEESSEILNLGQVEVMTHTLNLDSKLPAVIAIHESLYDQLSDHVSYKAAFEKMITLVWVRKVKDNARWDGSLDAIVIKENGDIRIMPFSKTHVFDNTTRRQPKSMDLDDEMDDDDI